MRTTPKMILILKRASSTVRWYKTLAQKMATTWWQELQNRVGMATTWWQEFRERERERERESAATTWWQEFRDRESAATTWWQEPQNRLVIATIWLEFTRKSHTAPSYIFREAEEKPLYQSTSIPQWKHPCDDWSRSNFVGPSAVGK